MSEYVMAGAGVALFTLIFSSTPFVQLIYFLAIQNVADWTAWSVVTGFHIIVQLGANLYRSFKGL